ncbi:hypothetical protein CHN51_18520 (plasmid) [Sphingorhabdus sp. YGSMI21]|nr:hypothetical protein CHN51_18520 [Sphingorhabdus sp. YGSMI21]
MPMARLIFSRPKKRSIFTRRLERPRMTALMADGRVEGERQSPSIRQTVKLTGELVPCGQGLFDEPPFPRCRDMGANRGAIDAVVAAVGHDHAQYHRCCLP